MISSLVDGVLLLALVTTSGVVGAMYFELRRQRHQRAAHQLLLAQTAETLAAIDQRMGEINTRGHGVLRELSERVAEAKLLLSHLDGLPTPAAHVAPGTSKH